MQVEHAILIRASAERIFQIYEDVSAWHAWDPDTKHAELHGPFAVGTLGTLTPSQGKTVPIQITKVEPNKSFTAESRIPFFHMVFDHELVPQGDGLQVIHRVTLSGPLTALIGRMVVARLHQGFPTTLGNLKRLAECEAP